MVEGEAIAAEAAGVAALRVALRLEGTGEDPVLGGLLIGALARCEGFLGAAVTRRAFVETLGATGGWWQTLAVAPVRAITGVAQVVPGGVDIPLPASAYEVDILANGRGRVRLLQPFTGAIAVRYEAGLASGWAALPDGVRTGIVRLVGHWFGGGDGPEPSSVQVLWHPYRRTRLL